MFWISFRAATRESIEINFGLYDFIRGGIRIGLIRTYAHTLPMKGTYLLIMALPKDSSVMVGKHGIIHFQKGCYAYVGSALNGLDQRIQRHLRTDKKTHWHIDYLLPFTEIVDILYKENNRREECQIAQSLERNFASIPGFGCSDCSCNSHLFFGSFDKIIQTISSLHMKMYLLD
jgi:Uri superfamily endonuclease